MADGGDIVDQSALLRGSTVLSKRQFGATQARALSVSPTEGRRDSSAGEQGAAEPTYFRDGTLS